MFCQCTRICSRDVGLDKSDVLSSELHIDPQGSRDASVPFAETLVAEPPTTPKAQSEMAPQELRLVIDRGPAHDVGMDIDIIDGVAAVIMDILPGPIRDWNDANPKQCLIEGDRIVSVNGTRGDAARLVERLRQERRWELVLHRPVEIILRASEIRREDEAPHFPLAHHSQDKTQTKVVTWGLDVRYAAEGSSFLIRGLQEGLAKRWNERNPAAQVREGDRIVAVNGQRGLAKDLLKRALKVVELTVRRYPDLVP